MKIIKLNPDDDLRRKQLADALKIKNELAEILKNRAEILPSKINKK